MQVKTNAYAVIPSSKKNGTEADKLSIKQMLNDGIAVGFRGTVERVKAQRFIVVVDKDNRKAYYADILRVTKHHKPESGVPRVDVKFGIIRTLLWSDLMKQIQVDNGQANTRYFWLPGFHRM
ncbi:hypothetical protein HLBENOHH_02440 [Aeromonas dhakensis]|uniref:hypothetical protein n=1 Tax=Aeromonas dhakensis TaxID=196024 RepID=UPI00366ACC1A